MNYECDGVYTGPSGYLASIDTDKDGQYDKGQDCQWTISLRYTYVILFEVVKQDIAHARGTMRCGTDFLEVGIGLSMIQINFHICCCRMEYCRKGWGGAKRYVHCSLAITIAVKQSLLIKSLTDLEQNGFSISSQEKLPMAIIILLTLYLRNKFSLPVNYRWLTHVVGGQIKKY